VEAILERLLERLSTIVKELPSDERRMFTVVELRQRSAR
jgi:DNA-directed RNA polymerase specialized sigma24 family protein